MEDIWVVEFVVMVVFHLQIYLDKLMFFSLQTVKGRTSYFSKKKGGDRVVL